VIVFGGACCNGGPYKYFNDVFLFDCENLKWTSVACKGPLPSPRAQHSAVLINPTTLFLLGGYNGTQVLVDAHTLDLTTFTWAPVRFSGDIPSGITGMSQTQYRVYPAAFGLFFLAETNQILAYGLGKCRDEPQDPRIYLLDLESGIWTKLGNITDLPVISCPTGCMINNKEAVVLGGLGADGGESGFVYKVSVC